MTAIIILAAGASLRLGRAKQTLPYKDETLLKHTIKAAVDSGIGPVIVVVGANEKEIRAHIENAPVSIILNRDFQEGIASSIKVGVSYILDTHKDCENMILMVCDQPYVNANLLKNLCNTKQTTRNLIAACSYKDTIGVPALFDKALFGKLLLLKGEEGGKKVLFQHKEKVATIPFPEGVIDIDTEADYEALNE
jgi:molybdenum cofactor cytidylyltransferase